MSEPVLKVSGLAKRFAIRSRGHRRLLTAVDGVDLEVHARETVALIGESGSGKSTVARCIARLVEPTAGEVTLGGRNLTAAPKASLWRFYSDLQMVFQDPSSSLNPRMTARQSIEEPIRLHTTLTGRERASAVGDLLGQVGLRAELGSRYPRQLSGGECQRVAIARALAVEPKVLLLDEPTASLDVSVRGQILDLLERLQSERQLAYLFISHDLGVVRHIGDQDVHRDVPRRESSRRAARPRSSGSPSHPYTTGTAHRRPASRLRGSTEAPEADRRDPERSRPAAWLPPGLTLSARAIGVLNTPPARVAISATHQAACPVVAQARDASIATV